MLKNISHAANKCKTFSSIAENSKVSKLIHLNVNFAGRQNFNVSRSHKKNSIPLIIAHVVVDEP